jgi:transcriptional regulator GlxA family with amidase domain
MTYIEANLHTDIRAATLARVVALRRGPFVRAFRESFGESPPAYVTKQRIQRAQKLMLSSQAPLCQIALECGMSDQSHLTRVFRKIMGLNPARWRRQHGDRTDYE